MPLSAQIIEATKRVQVQPRRGVSNLLFKFCSEGDRWILLNNPHVLKSHALDLNLGGSLKTRVLANKRMSLSSFFIMNIFFDSPGIAVRASGGLRSRPSQPVCVPGPQGALWRLTPYLGSQNSSWSAASLTASEV